MWHGYLEGHPEVDGRGLTEEIARWKVESVAAPLQVSTRLKWLSDNPMKSLHPPKVKQDPTLPFCSDEVNAVVSACDRFAIKGVHGEGNRRRLRAMIFLLRYSGLRIRDAATLARERLHTPFTCRKTGVPVFVPLQPYVVEALQETPNTNPRYFFWSGNGLLKTTVADWERSLRKLFEIANVKGGHAHRFRDNGRKWWEQRVAAERATNRRACALEVTDDRTQASLDAFWTQYDETELKGVRARQEQLESAVMKTWPSHPHLPLGQIVAR